MENFEIGVSKAVEIEKTHCANICRASAARHEIAAKNAARRLDTEEEIKLLSIACKLNSIADIIETL